MKKKFWGLTSLVGVAAAIAVAFVVVPALGSDDVIELRLTETQQGFFVDGINQQPLAERRCEVDAVDGPVVSLDSQGKPGLDSYSLGDKTRGSQGIPCGRVEAEYSEFLELTPSEAGQTWDYLLLDLELKAGAEIDLTLYTDGGDTVLKLTSGGNGDSGAGPVTTVTSTFDIEESYTVSCNAAADSDPDSGASDNCLWIVEGFPAFAGFKLTAVAGDFSLQGGIDTGQFTEIGIANQAPVAKDDSYTTDEDVPLQVEAPGVLGNDLDGDGDTLTASVASGPSNGTLQLNDNGSFTYTPNLNWSGTDSFTYQVSDGQATDQATVTITVAAVNDPPVAVDDTFTVSEDAYTGADGPATLTVLANDSDVENDPMTIGSITNVVYSDDFSGAIITTDGSSVSLDTNEVFESLGADDEATITFDYSISDGNGGSDTATVQVTIDGKNDAPESASGNGITDTVAEDSESNQITIAEDVDDEVITLDCTLADGETLPSGVTDNGDGTISYSPPDDFFGTVSFSCIADDGDATSQAISVTITVTAVNDPPEANPDTGTMDDRAYLDLPDDDPDEGVILTANTESFPVVDNDTDIDDDNADLSIKSVGTPTTSAYADSDGPGVAVASSDGRSVTFTPDIEWPVGVFSVDVSIPYVVQDDDGASDDSSAGILTVTVERVICSAETVTASDSSGTLFASGSFTLLSDQPICKNYSTSADALNQTVTFVPGTGDTARFLGELTFTPTLLDNGTFSAGLEYERGDGLFRPIQACVNPVFVDGEFVSAEFPLTPELDDADATESWCLVQVIGTATGSDGLVEPVFILYGEEDPTFKFR